MNPYGKGSSLVPRRLTGLALVFLLAPVPMPAPERPAPPVVEWTLDGKVLIAANGLLARFDLDSDQEELLGEDVATFALSADGSRLAVAGPERLELRGYPEFAPQATLALPNPAEITSLAWSPDGATLAAGTGAGHLLLWDAATRDWWADLQVEPASPVSRLRFSASGVRLLSAFEDGRAVLWDVERREVVHRFGLPRNPEGEPEAGTSIVDLSPDGRRVLTTRMRAGESELVLLDDAGNVQWRRAGYAVEFTRDGAALLALAAPFRIAALYRTRDAEALQVFEPPDTVRTLYLVRQSPDGKFLLGVGEDYRGQALLLWDFATARVLTTHR